MALLQWDSRYSVQVESLDEDHRRLFACFNQVWLVLAQRQERATVGAALEQAQAALTDHFAQEEAFLAEVGYPRLASHTRQHRQLVRHLGRLVAGYQRGQLADLDPQALDFIQDWFCNHILKHDRHYGQFVANRASGAMPFSPARRPVYATLWGDYLAPLIVLGVAVSLVLTWVVYQYQKTADEARFRELASRNLMAVSTDLDMALDSLNLIARHFSVTDPGEASPGIFRRLTEPLLEHHSFIQGVSWQPKVLPELRAAFEQLQQAAGRPGFRILERTAEGELEQAAPGSAPLFPVTLVEPQATNFRALGFDLASDPVRRAALEQARDSGRPRSTARLTLVQDTGDQFGVLLLVPVFAAERAFELLPELARSSLERQRALTGYLAAIFRLSDLVELSQSLPGQPSAEAGALSCIYLFDLTTPGESAQLYPRRPEVTLAGLQEGLHVTSTIDVGGRTWQLVAVPGPAFLSRPSWLNVWVVLLASLLATGFLVHGQKADFQRMETAARFAREIARNKQRLSEAQRIARVGFIEFDPASGCWQLGPGSQPMLGLAPTLTCGTSTEVFAEVAPADRERLLAALAGGAGAGLDLELKLGERVLHVLGGGAGGGAGGDGDGSAAPGPALLLTFRDISHRYQAERERAALVERMAEVGRLESLGALAGGIAHEINTPTQYIGDNLSFIQDSLTPLLALLQAAEAARESGDWTAVAAQTRALPGDFLAAELPAAAEQAQSGIARISSIVKAIKDFSYPSSRHPAPMDLNRAVDLALTVTRNQWKYVAEIEPLLEPALPRLSAIEGEINQVLVNLIVNAAQAIGEHKQAELGRITITTRLVGEEVELTVSDTGVGIPPENLERLYDLFFTTKPPGEGTGQGLAITRAIILRHGGTISAESTPGAGATFRIRLPLAPPASGEDRASLAA